MEAEHLAQERRKIVNKKLKLSTTREREYIACRERGVTFYLNMRIIHDG